jgi:copper chaperone CopZ
MRNIVILLLLLTFGISAQAQTKKNKNARYTIEVNGNCDQCKKRIEKAAYAVAGVKSASWSIETHQLDLIVNEEKTTITDVKKALAKAATTPTKPKPPTKITRTCTIAANIHENDPHVSNHRNDLFGLQQRDRREAQRDCGVIRATVNLEKAEAEIEMKNHISTAAFQNAIGTKYTIREKSMNRW